MPPLLCVTESGANVEHTIYKDPATKNAKGPSGCTPLYLAAANGSVALCHILIHAHALIDQSYHSNGWNALGVACEAGHQKCVELLLEGRADINRHEVKYICSTGQVSAQSRTHTPLS